MRIMHILSDSNIGGAGILLENLLRHTGLPKEDICVLLPRKAAMGERYRALGVGTEVPRPRPRVKQQSRGRKGQPCRAQAKEGM